MTTLSRASALPDPQPELVTPRLRLRRPARSDAGDIRRLAGEFAVADMTLRIPHPYPDGAAEAWIDSLAPAYDQGRQAVFAITEAPGGGFCGCIGLTLHLEHDRAELGYWVGRPLWGRGYATEAARAVLAWGFGALALHRINAHCFVRNSASARVLLKLGMRHEGRGREHFKRWNRYEDVDEYGILREEFETS